MRFIAVSRRYAAAYRGLFGNERWGTMMANEYGLEKYLKQRLIREIG
jgi:hypothetical protein